MAKKPTALDPPQDAGMAQQSAAQMAGQGEFLLYQTEDAQTHIQVRFQAGGLWLTQRQLAELYQSTPQNITQHIRSIYESGELQEEETCKPYLQVRQESGRQVSRSLKHYNLDMVLAVGYRVKSHRGTQFRRAELDNFLRMTRKDILTHAGKVSAEAALAKAQAAYDTYQARARELPSQVEKDFEATIARPVQRLEKGRKALPKKKKGDEE